MLIINMTKIKRSIKYIKIDNNEIRKIRKGLLEIEIVINMEKVLYLKDTVTIMNNTHSYNSSGGTRTDRKVSTESSNNNPKSTNSSFSFSSIDSDEYYPSHMDED
jgi:hypothetical protein